MPGDHVLDEILLGLLDLVDVVDEHGDVVGKTLAHQAQGAGLERHKNNIILVAAAKAAGTAFRRQYPDHLERDIADKDVLPQRILPAGKNFAGHRRPQYGNRRVIGTVLFGEEYAPRQRPVVHFRHIVRNRRDRGRVILPLIANGVAALQLRQRAENVRQVFRDGFGILERECGRYAAPLAGDAGRLQGQAIGADLADAIDDILARAFPDGQHGYHGRDANHDAKQGENRAKNICLQ